MREQRDIDAVLLAGIRSRLALLTRALAGFPPPPSQAQFVGRTVNATLAQMADIERALRGPSWDTAVPTEVRGCLRRALRLVEPALLEARVQVVLELQGADLRATVAEGTLLRLLASLLREAILCATPCGTLTVAAGVANTRPWVWLTMDCPPREGEPPEIAVSPAVRDLAGRLGADVDLAAQEPGNARRSLRLTLAASPAAARAPIARLNLSRPRDAPQPGHAATAPSPPSPAAAAGRPDPTPPPAAAASRAPAMVPPSPDPDSATAARALAEVSTRASAALEAFFSQTTPRRVLVVDDEEALLGLFATALPTIGIEIDVATSAGAALDVMQPGRFSLAIVDKNLPDRTGLELLQALRARDAHLGAILVTGYSSAHAVSGALELGVYDYVDKPFPDFPILLSRIELAMQRHALHTRVALLAERIAALAPMLPAGLADARVERLRALLDTSTPQPINVAVLAPPALIEYLTDPFAPITDGETVVTSTPEALRAQLASRRPPDLVVADPGRWPESLATLVALGRDTGAAQPTQIVAISRDDSLALALDALDAGVMDYLLVSEATPDQIRRRIQLALQRLRTFRRDRAVLLELLGVDIAQRRAPGVDEAPGIQDLADFEPTLGGAGGTP